MAQRTYGANFTAPSRFIGSVSDGSPQWQVNAFGYGLLKIPLECLSQNVQGDGLQGLKVRLRLLHDPKFKNA